MLGIKMRWQHGFRQENIITPTLPMSGAIVLNSTSFLPIAAHTKSWSGLGQSEVLAWTEGTELSQHHISQPRASISALYKNPSSKPGLNVWCGYTLSRPLSDIPSISAYYIYPGYCVLAMSLIWEVTHRDYLFDCLGATCFDRGLDSTTLLCVHNVKLLNALVLWELDAEWQ